MNFNNDSNSKLNKLNSIIYKIDENNEIEEDNDLSTMNYLIHIYNNMLKNYKNYELKKNETELKNYNIVNINNEYINDIECNNIYIDNNIDHIILSNFTSLSFINILKNVEKPELIKSIHLIQCKFEIQMNNDIFKILLKFKNLESFSCINTKIPFNIPSVLSECNNIQYLNFTNSELEDEDDLIFLSNIKYLKCLLLINTNITNIVFDYIVNCENLLYLNVKKCYYLDLLYNTEELIKLNKLKFFYISLSNPKEIFIFKNIIKNLPNIIYHSIN